MFYETTATRKVKAMRKRIRAVQGGTSASKTVSILLYLIARCQYDHSPTLTSVVSETLPHLKKGAIRDFLMIMQEHNYFKDERWNKSDFVYTFETGSKLEFFSADQASKVRGPRRDRLFLNEANNLPYNTFDQLEIRTKEFIFLDWNPSEEFWFYTEVLNKRDDVEHLILTYKDNEALDKQIIRSIEQRMGNAQWWQVFGLGQLGVAEGRIYTDWQLIDEIPHEAVLERYGLDFGYTNDPSAIVAVYRYNGGLILDEIVFERGLQNRQLADVFRNLPKALIIADSAEPKSIDELREYGLTVLPAVKGKDSVNHGIQYVQSQRISVTKRSTNMIKEYRNYLWLRDPKTDARLNEPSPVFDHCMDALRYAISSMKPHEAVQTYKQPEWEGISVYE